MNELRPAGRKFCAKRQVILETSMNVVVILDGIKTRPRSFFPPVPRGAVSRDHTGSLRSRSRESFMPPARGRFVSTRIYSASQPSLRMRVFVRAL